MNSLDGVFLAIKRDLKAFQRLAEKFGRITSVSLFGQS
jgi:TfoX/Sxy family transcriptional regulator of competence genes